MRRLLSRLVVVLAAVGLVHLAPVPMAWSAPATRAAIVRDAGRGAQTPFPSSHFGVRWTGDEEAVVEVRSHNEDGWGPWQQVEADHDMSEGTGGVVFGALVVADAADRVQTRVVSGEARDVVVDAFDTRHGPRKLVRATREAAGSSASASMADTRVGQPGVITRAQWGADESMRKAGPSFAPISRLVVHHTATPNGDPDPAATVRAVYAYHVQSRGWNDIGYNFLVDEQGRIYEGRWSRTYAAGETPTGEDAGGRGVIGAHAEGG
ncbi:MAG TPA: N-acetylmuramoyl-L-alanine amidase, partial [Acidimicrobiales bacterium]